MLHSSQVTPGSGPSKLGFCRESRAVLEKLWDSASGFRGLMAAAPEPDGSRLWPLLLFLHGSGERGDDTELLKRHGPPKLVAAGRRLQGFLLAPQAPAEAEWDIAGLETLLLEALARLPVDRERIYLTGVSRGGYGAWRLAARRPDLFAALAPICGWGDPADAVLCRDIPTWVIHGGRDTRVPPAHSERMVRARTDLGRGAPIRLSIYPEDPHDSWTRAYEQDDLLDWLFRQWRPMP